MSDLIATQIYKTKDYEKFVLDQNLNRDVSNANVKKIKSSIKDYGDHGMVFPIVVDDRMRIIDGQHRFTARKELGLTIYYIQDLDLDISKLGGINDAVKKWVANDYEKVNSSKSFYKILRSYKDSVDFDSRISDLPVRVFAKTLLGISDKSFTSANEEYTGDINVKFNLLKPYIKWCVEKLFNCNFKGTTNIPTATQVFRYLGPIAKKLLSNKVDLSQLNSSYTTVDSLMVDLYQKGFLKK